MPRRRERRARRPVPGRRAAGRRRHIDEHEHERGHRQSGVGARRASQRRLWVHPPERRREPFTIDQRHLPRGLQARADRRHRAARGRDEETHAGVPRPRRQAHERRHHRTHPAAGCGADDLRSGIPRIRKLPEKRPPGPRTRRPATDHTEPRRHRHRHRHLRRPAVPHDRHTPSGRHHRAAHHRGVGSRGGHDRYERIHRHVADGQEPRHTPEKRPPTTCDCSIPARIPDSTTSTCRHGRRAAASCPAR